MPSRLSNRMALVLGGLLIAVPQESFAQRHGARPHGGGWNVGGSHGYQRGYVGGYPGRYGYGRNVVNYGYGGYGGYPGYVGYRGYAGYPRYYGYRGYYGHHHDHDNNNGVWIALGAGVLGLIVGSALSRPRVYQHAYPSAAPPPPPPQPPAPEVPRCQDGTPVPVGGYCTAPPPVPPPPMGERG